MWKYYRNKVEKERKRLAANYYQTQVKEAKETNPKQWWKGVKNLMGKSNDSNPLITMANELHEGDMNSLAEDVNNFFQSITAHLEPLQPLDWEHGQLEVPSKYQLTVEQTEKSLLSINCTKSPGPDSMPNWVLRDFAGVLGKPVCAIWNNSLRSGCVPDIWKCANVVPLPKVTPPSKVDSDLRPVSLTAILIKELESFVFKWLWDILGSKIKKDQYGSVKGCSTTMALIELFDAWAKASDVAATQIRILFLDFRKAFDLIDHNILLAKLMSLDVPPILLRWVHAFLFNRKQRIKIGQSMSDWANINGGVPQGTKLGPLLFITMINDMDLSLPAVKYVDDTTPTPYQAKKKGKLPPTSKLQEAADKIHKWTCENNMVLNAKKTKEMFICFSKRPNVPPNIVIDQTDIEVVTCTKLLGVHISNDLKWHKHIDTIYSKAASRIYFLCMLKHASVPPEDLVEVYVTIVRPVVEYACELWHPGVNMGQTRALESIQKRALHVIFPNLSYTEALKSTNLPTLEKRRNSMCHKLYEKVLDKDHRLHHLLPEVKSVHHKLRAVNTYETPKCITNRYKHSFIPFCLENFQVQT